MNSLASLESHLRATIEGEVRFDAGTRAAYATDASNYRQVPVGVVIPRHEGDVIAALSLARENAMPILARGGGTSLAGQACNAALVLDFSKYMNRVLAIDPDARTAQVEPGVVQSHLNTALAPHGLFFAPDPSTKDRCTIGGMIGNNSCGAHSAAYGKTVDNVEALEVVLYDGTELSLTGSIDDAQLDAAIARGGREGELYSRLRELRDRTARFGARSFPETAAPRLRLQPRRADARARLQRRARDRRFGGHARHDFARDCASGAAPQGTCAGRARLRRRFHRRGSNAVAAGASILKRSKASTRICRSSRVSSRCRACGFCPLGARFCWSSSAARRATRRAIVPNA